MRRSLLVMSVLFVLLLPVAARAATPTTDIYDPKDKQESSGVPFTGLDVGIVALAGVLVLGTGLAVRRAARAD